jgi:hypothetical protein
VPLVIPIPQAWRVFDKEGHTHDEKVAEQLHALGHEVTRAARQFASQVMTIPEARAAEAQVEPVSEGEARNS